MIGENNTGEKKTYLPLAPALYTVQLKNAEERTTKKGDGMYIDSTFEVVEGEHRGRLIFHKFLLEHPSAKAADIGKQQLDKFLKAVGVSDGFSGIDYDSNRIGEAGNRMVVANVKIEKGTNGYKDRNKITSFSVR